MLIKLKASNINSSRELTSSIFVTNLALKLILGVSNTINSES
ncbi:hypothetical protein [Pseudoalteromonas sp. NBT06-2]|nr:hypothetical protein [Pseudoalteromonas sp. NBT06-2]